jgi:hypothetical protein
VTLSLPLNVQIIAALRQHLQPAGLRVKPGILPDMLHVFIQANELDSLGPDEGAALIWSILQERLGDDAVEAIEQINTFGTDTDGQQEWVFSLLKEDEDA